MRHALRGAPVAIVAAVLLAILAAPAAASGSLAVNTGAATEITAKAATLHGTVTVKEGGEGALTGFEYGTTSEYGEGVGAQQVSGTGTHDVHAEIEGLQPETTYHYRVVALNEGGIVYGEDKTFTTIERFAPRFDAEEHPVEIVGAQNKQLALKAAGGSVACNVAVFSSEAASPTSQLELDADYSGCIAFGLSASVAMNSCRYVLRALNVGPPYAGELDIACAEEGDLIEVIAGGGICKLEIGPQQGLGSIELENVGSGEQRQVEADLDISGISYTAYRNSFLCPATGGSNDNGTLTGSIELSGFRG